MEAKEEAISSKKHWYKNEFVIKIGISLLLMVLFFALTMALVISMENLLESSGYGKVNSSEETNLLGMFFLLPTICAMYPLWSKQLFSLRDRIKVFFVATGWALATYILSSVLFAPILPYSKLPSLFGLGMAIWKVRKCIKDFAEK